MTSMCCIAWRLGAPLQKLVQGAATGSSLLIWRRNYGNTRINAAAACRRAAFTKHQTAAIYAAPRRVQPQYQGQQRLGALLMRKFLEFYRSNTRPPLPLVVRLQPLHDAGSCCAVAGSVCECSALAQQLLGRSKTQEVCFDIVVPRLSAGLFEVLLPIHEAAAIRAIACNGVQ